MILLRNFVLYLLVFLPVAALAGMLMQNLGLSAEVSPEWEIGWNPILWMIVTVPWLLPTILAVPILHYLSRWLTRRFPKGRARIAVMIASAILFTLALLVLWGPGNFSPDFILPALVSALIYGAVFRMPDPPSEE